MANTSEALKQKIRDALAQLDRTNDAHWTTDGGLPVTAVVQKLANDTSIKRSDINEAAPGFVRPDSDPPENLGASDVSADKVAVTAVVEGRELTPDEMRAVMAQRVYAAENRLNDIRKDLKDLFATEKRQIDIVREVKLDMARKFPPLTPMQNIKQHLESEQRRRTAESNQRRAAMGMSPREHMATSLADRALNAKHKPQALLSGVLHSSLAVKGTVRPTDVHGLHSGA